VKALLRHPNFPLLLLLLIGLAAGLPVYNDYGLSWDEPLFYQYAAAIPGAYSIQARLDGTFNMEDAYGPSADHAAYGPAYLLLAQPLVDGLDALTQSAQPDLWHLVNYLTFVIGALLLYLLCRRWVSPWAAFGAALLFLTQPVLWGHAWINPKDMPFLVFFVAAMLTGLRLVDVLKQGAPSPQLSMEQADRRWQRRRWAWQVAGIVLVALALIAVLFYGSWQALFSDLIQKAYLAPAASTLGRLFSRLAPNAGQVAVDAYINKALIWLNRLKLGLVGGTLLVAVPALALTFWLDGVRRLFGWLEKHVGPLPTPPGWWVKGILARRWLFPALLAGAMLGLLTSNRIVGPLAGLLVALSFFLYSGRRPWVGLLVYALAGGLVCLATWPYLWEAPLSRFIEVLRHMSDNPHPIPVLFNGLIYQSDKLPASYLPGMLALTLSEPVWLLFLGGVGVGAWRTLHQRLEWRDLLPVLLWFLLPFTYVVLRRPPIYDGYRHFMFILPPVFVFIALALQALFERLRRSWASALLLLVILLPGVIALVSLHPYQYTYYNSLVGSTGGAFRRYETDYWLTCYRELVGELNQSVPQGGTLFVYRQPSIAAGYAIPGINVLRYDPDDDQTFSGSLLLLTTRANVDLDNYTEAPELLSVGRDGAVFCLVRQIP
jgi:hypothetical protein